MHVATSYQLTTDSSTGEEIRLTPWTGNGPATIWADDHELVVAHPEWFAALKNPKTGSPMPPSRERYLAQDCGPVRVIHSTETVSPQRLRKTLPSAATTAARLFAFQRPRLSAGDQDGSAVSVFALLPPSATSCERSTELQLSATGSRPGDCCSRPIPSPARSNYWPCPVLDPTPDGLATSLPTIPSTTVKLRRKWPRARSFPVVNSTAIPMGSPP
jgi:hypothetical protein